MNLSGNRPSHFWIPSGFAHGFCVVSNEGADVLYKVDNFWNSLGEGAILWNDQNLNIKWPIVSPVISEKDEKAANFDFNKIYF